MFRLYSSVGVVACAALLVYLERRFPYTPGQKILREGFWDDFVWYTVVQSYVLGLAISVFIQSIDAVFPLTRLHLLSSLNSWRQFVVFFCLHDFYIYWFHRWQHHNFYLWRIHEAHHSTKDVDWLSGSRSHPLEILINQTIEFAPMTLLGAPAELIVLKGAVDAVWGMYIHSNVNVRSGWLQYLVNGPEMHRWHHTAGKEAHHYNFSTKLAVWDWLFGTAYRPHSDKPQQFGLKYRHFPKGYWLQLLYAFRKRAG